MNKKLFSVLVIVFFFACSSTYATETKKTDTKTTTDTNQPEAKTQNSKSSSSMAASGASGDTTSGSVGQAASLSPLLSESFQTDLATGSATAGIPIVIPPGRKNMQPSLAISYSSNNPNGICGVGWGLTTSSIQRSTKKGLPKYDSTDMFDFASSGSSGDLVLIDASNSEYRPKIENAFMKYVFDSANSKWTVRDKAGTRYVFGSSVDSRIVNSDGTKTFAWFLDSVTDVYGNTVTFIYIKDSGQIYLSKANYTANIFVTPQLASDKEIDFIYETGRPDITYNNRAGWQIGTVQRLKEIQVKVDGSLVWRYALTYIVSGDTHRSLLGQVTLFDAAGNSLPPKKFTYQTIE